MFCYQNSELVLSLRNTVFCFNKKCYAKIALFRILESSHSGFPLLFCLKSCLICSGAWLSGIFSEVLFVKYPVSEMSVV